MFPVEFWLAALSCICGCIVTYLVTRYWINRQQTVKVVPTMQDMQTTLQSLRESITSYLLTDGVAVFGAIAKQKEILNHSNRRAVAIFVSNDMFRQILVNTFQDQDSPYIDEIVETFTSMEMPVAYLGELPIYVSARLQKAPVFVSGEIEWSMTNGR